MVKYLFCSKIGAECPHRLIKDNKYVFVMMPFKKFDSVYDAIKTAVKEADKTFKCERSDEKYTNKSIWCNRICINIRKAKFLIVDTTGGNPNVFYELGFSHVIDDTKAIIITQDRDTSPFDILDVNQIEYTEKNFPDLRKKIKNAILTLKKEDDEEERPPKSADEII